MAITPIWKLKSDVKKDKKSFKMNKLNTSNLKSLKNSFSTIMPPYYNYTHDVILLTSLIVIHLLKFNMWHYEIFWT
jgi:hypothetical protein